MHRAAARLDHGTSRAEPAGEIRERIGSGHRYSPQHEEIVILRGHADLDCAGRPITRLTRTLAHPAVDRAEGICEVDDFSSESILEHKARLFQLAAAALVVDGRKPRMGQTVPPAREPRVK